MVYQNLDAVILIVANKFLPEGTCPAAELGSPPFQPEIDSPPFLGRRRELRPCLTTTADGEETPGSSRLDDYTGDMRWSCTGLHLPRRRRAGDEDHGRTPGIVAGAWRTAREL